jgi:hypothetical protein
MITPSTPREELMKRLLEEVKSSYELRVQKISCEVERLTMEMQEMKEEMKRDREGLQQVILSLRGSGATTPSMSVGDEDLPTTVGAVPRTAPITVRRRKVWGGRLQIKSDIIWVLYTNTMLILKVLVMVSSSLLLSTVLLLKRDGLIDVVSTWLQLNRCYTAFVIGTYRSSTFSCGMSLLLFQFSRIIETRIEHTHDRIDDDLLINTLYIENTHIMYYTGKFVCWALGGYGTFAKSLYDFDQMVDRLAELVYGTTVSLLVGKYVFPTLCGKHFQYINNDDSSPVEVSPSGLEKTGIFFLLLALGYSDMIVRRFFLKSRVVPIRRSIIEHLIWSAKDGIPGILLNFVFYALIYFLVFLLQSSLNPYAEVFIFGYFFPAVKQATVYVSIKYAIATCDGYGHTGNRRACIRCHICMLLFANVRNITGL